MHINNVHYRCSSITADVARLNIFCWQENVLRQEVISVQVELMHKLSAPAKLRKTDRQTDSTLLTRE